MQATQSSQPTQQLVQAVKTAVAAKFQPIEHETRSHVETGCAAFYLCRSQQTLRSWSCLENGPIRPIRINGRLAWAVADIKRLLNGGA